MVSHSPTLTQYAPCRSFPRPAQPFEHTDDVELFVVPEGDGKIHPVVNLTQYLGSVDVAEGVWNNLKRARGRVGEDLRELIVMLGEVRVRVRAGGKMSTAGQLCAPGCVLHTQVVIG